MNCKCCFVAYQRCSIRACGRVSNVHNLSETMDQHLSIAVLIDELKHEDVAVRVHAIQSLDRIALALGPPRTLAELFPFLQSTLDLFLF